MDFFKSILSDDTEPEISDNYEKSETDSRPNQSPKHQENERAEDDYSNSNSTSGDVGSGGGLWRFGDLVKTLTIRSESVLETYRRDLKEFGSGLRKESDLFREVASRAMKELPSSIEVGASAIDGVVKSTAGIISQGKDAFLEPSDVDDSDASEAQNYSDRSGLNSRGYSRFDSQLNSIQSDTRTYCGDPEDLDDYDKWKLGFTLGDKKGEIEKLIRDSEAVEGIYRKLVPDEVDDGVFWCRYFYRVHKLKQQEDMRANLVRRSLTVDDEKELSWDVDDDDQEEVNQAKPNVSIAKDLPEIEKKQRSNDESETVSSNAVDDDLEKNTGVASVDKNNAEELKSNGGDGSDQKVESVPKSDENLDFNENAGKDGDVLAVSARDEEEDLEWDEIEDLGDNDEKKVSHDDTPSKADLLKRLNIGEYYEDLSWDIEDDDEPATAGSSK